MQNAGIVIAVIAGMMLIILLIAMLVLARLKRRLRSRLAQLTTTTGWVRKAEPLHRGGGRIPSHWIVDLVVEFTAQGQRLVCRNLDFGTNRYATEEEMRAALRGLVPGTLARVWYDPDNPGYCALSPTVPGDPGLLARIALGLAAITAIGVAMAVLG